MLSLSVSLFPSFVAVFASLIKLIDEIKAATRSQISNWKFYLTSKKVTVNR